MNQSITLGHIGWSPNYGMPDLALLKRLSSSGATDCSASSFAPPVIHLQYHGDADDAEPVDDEFSEEHVTWCRDAIFRHDVRYIRWDLVERLLRDPAALADLWANPPAEDGDVPLKNLNL